MDAVTILFYGNKTLMDSLDGLSPSLWTTGGACGRWSVKDIMAHMSMYEHMLLDVLGGIANGADMPFLKRVGSLGDAANDTLVDETQDQSAEQVLDDYKKLHEQVMALARQIPAATWAQVGTIPWYGDGYALDDFVVYAFYGHKREHAGQINIFRDAHPA